MLDKRVKIIIKFRLEEFLLEMFYLNLFQECRKIIKEISH